MSDKKRKQRLAHRGSLQRQKTGDEWYHEVDKWHAENVGPADRGLFHIMRPDSSTYREVEADGADFGTCECCGQKNHSVGAFRESDAGFIEAREAGLFEEVEDEFDAMPLGTTMVVVDGGADDAVSFTFHQPGRSDVPRFPHRN